MVLWGGGVVSLGPARFEPQVKGKGDQEPVSRAPACLLGEWTALWQPEGVGSVIRHSLLRGQEGSSSSPRTSWKERDTDSISFWIPLSVSHVESWRHWEKASWPQCCVEPREVRSHRSRTAAPGQSSEESERSAVATVSPSQALHTEGTGSSFSGLLLPGEDEERQGVSPERSCWCVPRCLKRALGHSTHHTGLVRNAESWAAPQSC